MSHGANCACGDERRGRSDVVQNTKSPLPPFEKGGADAPIF